MVRIAICDTNKEDRILLEKILISIVKNKHLEYKITLFETSKQLLDEYYNGLFHILFLEINSHHANHHDIGKEIRKQDVHVDIVYCISNDTFVLKSDETFALSYLLKPLQCCKVKAIIDHYLHKNRSHRTKFIYIKQKQANNIVYYNDIIFISSNDRIATFHTLHQGQIPSYNKLKSISEELQDQRFLKCNRGFIVNMDYIIGIRENDFLTINNHLISIKLRERKQMINAYYEYLENHKYQPLCDSCLK